MYNYTNSAYKNLGVNHFIVLAGGLFGRFGGRARPRTVVPMQVGKRTISNSVIRQMLTFTFTCVTLVFIDYVILVVSKMKFRRAVKTAVSSVDGIKPKLNDLKPIKGCTSIPIMSG